MERLLIGVAPPGAIFNELEEIGRRLDAGEHLPEVQHSELNFSSAVQLFSELSPARLTPLETLKRDGAMSIYALAKRLGRHYSNVHGDVKKLIEYGLIAKDEEQHVYVPWDEMQINVSLGKAAA
jgi:predicted transcriptional regulator